MGNLENYIVSWDSSGRAPDGCTGRLTEERAKEYAAYMRKCLLKTAKVRISVVVEEFPGIVDEYLPDDEDFE